MELNSELDRKTKEVNQLKKGHEHILNISEDRGVSGCTYGDTDFDSLTVVYGYNLALEHVKSISEKALKLK